MAPVATETQTDQQGANGTAKAAVKPANGTSKVATQLFNPFYSPTNGTEGDDGDYKYAKYKVHLLFSCVLPCDPLMLMPSAIALLPQRQVGAPHRIPRHRSRAVRRSREEGAVVGRIAGDAPDACNRY